MQGPRGAIGSFSETSGFEHGSASSNHEPDYISLNSTNQDDQDVNLWNVSEQPPNIISFRDHVNNGHHGSSFEAYRGSTSSSLQFSEPYELDDRHSSRKRKAAEFSVGQSSSGIGSSNMFQDMEGPENPTRSDDIIPRIGLSVGRASSENPIVENEHRNVIPRISSSRQQDPLLPNSINRQPDLLALNPSLRLNPLDFRSPTLAETPVNVNPSSHQGQPVRVPALRRNFQSTSRSIRNSSSRANRMIFNLDISGDRNELDSISDHPLFSQSNNVQNELHWNSNTRIGGAVGNGGNVVAAASSRAGPSSGAAPPSRAPNSAEHRSSSHYNPRRLSAFLRRTLSATELESGGGPNSSIIPRISPSGNISTSAPQDLGIPPVVGIQAPHQPHSRSPVLFGRQLDGAFGFPNLSRATGSEGRGRLVSEIRNVLDLMRRGEPLRFEDLMILDQSVFYGIADIHDRHRDMRLDIDNMSYEELLALEDRIGNVNTGLTEEAISKNLKQKQYQTKRGQPSTEPCCICQEEYNNGDDLGTLECGHEFHHGCIKQWLQHKNLCPICKSMGFTTT